MDEVLNAKYNDSQRSIKKKKYLPTLLNDMKRDRYLYLLALPGIFFFIIFKYVPIWGVIISFYDYSPYLGLLGSKFVGLEHFIRFFSNPDFLKLFRNTLAISLLNLIFFFPLPIIISLMLNELKRMGFKRVVQSVIYIPHFFSWVIVYALTYLLFAKGSGIVNELLVQVGLNKIDVMTEPKNFWFVLVIQNMWKETGWGTIVFLAAISGIDQEMYEAARIDGAGKLRRIWNITLPSIAPIIVIMLILRMGHIMEVGFEQIFLMNNGAVSDVSDVFDLYVYRAGVQNGQFSFSTAVGLFKAVIGLILVVISNKFAKRMGQEGIY